MRSVDDIARDAAAELRRTTPVHDVEAGLASLAGASAYARPSAGRWWAAIAAALLVLGVAAGLWQLAGRPDHGVDVEPTTIARGLGPIRVTSCADPTFRGLALPEGFVAPGGSTIPGGSGIGYFFRCDEQEASNGFNTRPIEVYAGKDRSTVIAWWYPVHCGYPEGLVDVGGPAPSVCDTSTTVGGGIAPGSTVVAPLLQCVDATSLVTQGPLTVGWAAPSWCSGSPSSRLVVTNTSSARCVSGINGRLSNGQKITLESTSGEGGATGSWIPTPDTELADGVVFYPPGDHGWPVQLPDLAPGSYSLTLPVVTCDGVSVELTLPFTVVFRPAG